jgi:hypothetical protein
LEILAGRIICSLCCLCTLVLAPTLFVCRVSKISKQLTIYAAIPSHPLGKLNNTLRKSCITNEPSQATEETEKAGPDSCVLWDSQNKNGEEKKKRKKKKKKKKKNFWGGFIFFMSFTTDVPRFDILPLDISQQKEEES